jgi:hypothetical protein
MDKNKFFACLCLVALIGACAMPLPPVIDQTQPAPPATPSAPQTIEPRPIVREPQAQERPVSKPATQDKAEELFFQGLQQLVEPVNKDEYEMARHTFEILVSSYPESKWRDTAQAALRLIGEMDSYRNKILSERNMVNKLLTDRTKALQDNEQLKKDFRLLNEKHQAEFAALQQENEQLKKDIQLLKNLEIQLEKREKLLR